MKTINKLICILFILIFGFVSCTNKKYSDNDYLSNISLENSNGKVFILGHEVFRASNKTIDSLVKVLTINKITEYKFDVYPYQFGPEFDTDGNVMQDSIENKFWELGSFFSISSIKSLELLSVCSFNLNIEHENNSLENLCIKSHSCNFVKSIAPTKFSNLKCLRHVSFHRIELSKNDFEELSKINNLSSIIANDCLLDLKELLPLKEQIKYIDLSNSQVVNMQLISQFKNLEVLYIGSTGETDINWFADLKKIKGISIKKNKIINFNSLRSLNNLQKLFISKKEISNIPNELLNKKNVEIILVND